MFSLMAKKKDKNVDQYSQSDKDTKNSNEIDAESAMLEILERFGAEGETVSFTVVEHKLPAQGACKPFKSERVKVTVGPAGTGRLKTLTSKIVLDPIVGVQKPLYVQDEVEQIDKAEALNNVPDAKEEEIEGNKEVETGGEGADASVPDKKESEATMNEYAKRHHVANPDDPLAQFKKKLGGGLLAIKKKHDSAKENSPKVAPSVKPEAEEGAEKSAAGSPQEALEGSPEDKPEQPKPEPDAVQGLPKPQQNYILSQSQESAKTEVREKVDKKASQSLPNQLYAQAVCPPEVVEEAMLMADTRPLYRTGYFWSIPIVQFLATATVMVMFYSIPKSLSLSLAATTVSLITSLAIYESRRHVYSTEDNFTMSAMFGSASTLMFILYHMVKSPKCHHGVIPMNMVESVVTAMATFGLFNILKPT